MMALYIKALQNQRPDCIAIPYRHVTYRRDFAERFNNNGHESRMRLLPKKRLIGIKPMMSILAIRITWQKS